MENTLEEIQEVQDVDLQPDPNEEPLKYNFPNINGTFDLGGNFIDLTLTGNYMLTCSSCGVEIEEPTEKYIYEVQHLKNKRCVRPLSTMYYMFEEHTRYAHEDIGEGTGKVLVIKIRTDDEKYIQALTNSYLEESGHFPNDDMEAFNEWKKYF